MRVQELFDLTRIHVFAAANDHVFDAPDDVDVALVVHRGQVPGVHPARRVDRPVGCLRVVPVAEHDAVAAGAQLAGLPPRHRSAGGDVGDLDLEVRVHAADGGDL